MFAWTRGLRLLRWRDVGLRRGRCPYCGPSIFVRLRSDELGVRCLRCAGSAIHLSIGNTLRKHVVDLRGLRVCELSARGPLARFLSEHAGSTSLSEYVASAQPGEIRAGARNEDVQSLTYADASFDLVTHTEVLEHVPDDSLAMRELRRVLKPGGLMLFTIPMHEGEATIERARFRAGAIEQLLPPIYHGDPLRGGAPILAFRDYGRDIVTRLLAAGFAEVWIEKGNSDLTPWGFARPVVCARA